MASYTYLVMPVPIPGVPPGVIVRDNEAYIPCNLGNTDYQEFLQWLTEGNTAPEGWTGPTNSTTPSG